MDFEATFFYYLSWLDSFYWQYIGFTLLLFVGLFLTIYSGGYQLRALVRLPKTLKSLSNYSGGQRSGVSPLKLYFASIGGMIGLGNIVAVVTALTIGGPGAIFWLWCAAFVGVIIKYCEIFLGVRYRQYNAKTDSYDGGMMYCILKGFRHKRLGAVLAFLSALFMCIYGIEIVHFTVLIDTLEPFIHAERTWIVAGLLSLVFYIGIGGIRRLANVCVCLMPIFMVLYTILCGYVLWAHADVIPEFFEMIFKSAFNGHAGVGGFLGSTFLMAAQNGSARSVYSSDIAIGFDSIIHSETKVPIPQLQAQLAILATMTDAFICTLTLAVVYVTGLWKTTEYLKLSEYVGRALADHVPHSEILVLCIIFVAGFTTLQAYFNVGLKTAYFLGKRTGQVVYFAVALFAFWRFSYYDQGRAITIMSLCAGGLMFVHSIAILYLVKEVDFTHDKK